MKSFAEIIGAPDTWTFGSSFDIDGIRYFHGDGFTGLQAGINVIKSTFQSSVFGHTHQAGITYHNGLWSMNVGCLIDPSAYAFNYSAHLKNRPTLGAGIVEDGIPIFIPFAID